MRGIETLKVGTGGTGETSRETSSVLEIESLEVETGETEEAGSSGVREISTIVDIESSDDEGLPGTTAFEAGDCLPGAFFFLR